MLAYSDMTLEVEQPLISVTRQSLQSTIYHFPKTILLCLPRLTNADTIMLKATLDMTRVLNSNAAILSCVTLITNRLPSSTDQLIVDTGR